MNKNKFSAVALKYPPYAEAPVITAREKGFLAERMLKIAGENGVPVVKDEAVTDVLSLAEIGDCIPECAWLAVAGIFAMIRNLEE